MTDLDAETTPPNRNRWGLAAALLAAIAVLVVVALVASGGGDDDEGEDVATGSSTTTTAVPSTTSSTTTSTTSTTSAPSTTAAPAATAAPTTTAAPKTTIAPARCEPKTSSAKPAEPATAFYDAWRIGDRTCADKLGTDEAVDDLFRLKPNGPAWDFQGCTEAGQPDPYGDCAFTFEGGSTHFKLRYANATGWSIFEVYQVAD